MILLPLGEKVSAKPTDEGSLKSESRVRSCDWARLFRSSTPHSTSLREATFFRKGRGDAKRIYPATFATLSVAASSTTRRICWAVFSSRKPGMSAIGIGRPNR